VSRINDRGRTHTYSDATEAPRLNPSPSLLLERTASKTPRTFSGSISTSSITKSANVGRRRAVATSMLHREGVSPGHSTKMATIFRETPSPSSKSASTTSKTVNQEKGQQIVFAFRPKPKYTEETWSNRAKISPPASVSTEELKNSKAPSNDARVASKHARESSIIAGKFSLNPIKRQCNDGKLSFRASKGFYERTLESADQHFELWDDDSATDEEPNLPDLPDETQDTFSADSSFIRASSLSTSSGLHRPKVKAASSPAQKSNYRIRGKDTLLRNPSDSTKRIASPSVHELALLKTGRKYGMAAVAEQLLQPITGFIDEADKVGVDDDSDKENLGGSDTFNHYLNICDDSGSGEFRPSNKSITAPMPHTGRDLKHDPMTFVPLNTKTPLKQRPGLLSENPGKLPITGFFFTPPRRRGRGIALDVVGSFRYDKTPQLCSIVHSDSHEELELSPDVEYYRKASRPKRERCPSYYDDDILNNPSTPLGLARGNPLETSTAEDLLTRSEPFCPEAEGFEFVGHYQTGLH
jgi:hypothetical protein